jgi:hypothetical protein
MTVKIFYYHIIVVLGVHCDIYKSAYAVSQLNSPLHLSPLKFYPSKNRNNSSFYQSRKYQ